MSDPIPSPSLRDKINTFIWAVAATVVGAFVVALLYRSGIMDRAVSACVSWLAVTATIAAAIAFASRSRTDLTTP